MKTRLFHNNFVLSAMVIAATMSAGFVVYLALFLALAIHAREWHFGYAAISIFLFMIARGAFRYLGRVDRLYNSQKKK